MSAVDRALQAWEPIRRGAMRRGLLRTIVTDGPTGGTAAVWALGQVIAAALDLELGCRLAGRTAEAAAVRDDLAVLWKVLARYRHGEGYGPFPGDPTHYHDDNAWIALDLLQGHAQLGDPALLARATEVVRSLRRGEDPAGGVRWVERRGSPRNTCATAPAGQAALRLHLVTRDPDLLAFARRQAEFLDAVLRRDDDLVADNVDADSRVEPTVWSYNQGTPVGLEVLLHRVDGDPAHLDRARRTADAAVTHFGGGGGDGLWAQAPVFNGIFLRNLLGLGAAVGDDRYRRAATAWADRVAAEGIRPDGWIGAGGIGRYEQGGTLDQAGWVQVLAVLAVPDEHLDIVS